MAMPSANGVEMSRAPNPVTSVPTIIGSAPNFSVTGFHSLCHRKGRPKVAQEVRDVTRSWTRKSAIVATRATAATRLAAVNTLSRAASRRSLGDGRAAIGHRVHENHCLLYRCGGESGIGQPLVDGLAVGEHPGQQLLECLHLGKGAADVVLFLVDEDPCKGADGVGIFPRAVHDHDAQIGRAS